MDSFKSISLFSGAQGLDIGLGLAGVDIVLGQDVEPSCVQTMAANGHKGIVGDIRSIAGFKRQSGLEVTTMFDFEPLNLTCSDKSVQLAMRHISPRSRLRL